MRQDPPFDLAYITATHLLEHVRPTTLVVNDPASVRNAPEKLFVTRFGEFMPPTLISRNPSELRAFRAEHRDIVIKPLYANGGAGVFRIKEDDENFASFVETFHLDVPRTFHDPEICSRGPVGRQAHHSGRWCRCGRHQPCAARQAKAVRTCTSAAGRSLPKLTPREEQICEAFGPELKTRGLIFVGIDVIGGLSD